MRWPYCATICLLICLVASSLFAVDRIPGRAYEYQKTIHAESLRNFGLNMPADTVAIAAGTIQQESEWNPLAQSSHARGMTQFTTPTWEWIVGLDPSIAQLGDVWSPKAAIRAMSYYHARLFKVQTLLAATECDTWAFVLSSYNGGAGNLNVDRRLTQSAGKDPTRWFENVEMYSRRTPEAIRENRQYVDRIWNRWRPLYAKF